MHRGRISRGFVKASINSIFATAMGTHVRKGRRACISCKWFIYIKQLTSLNLPSRGSRIIITRSDADAYSFFMLHAGSSGAEWLKGIAEWHRIFMNDLEEREKGLKKSALKFSFF